MTPETIEDHINKIALLFRYGTKEKILIFIGASLLGLATWLLEVDIEPLKSLVYLQQIVYGLYGIGGLYFAWANRAQQVTGNHGINSPVFRFTPCGLVADTLQQDRGSRR